ncbi:MAG: acyl-CoA dehydrogenase family protein [Deltaproteobacteria bacterium]|nr:acyl-CoA dehydrogenase family protein [Deltaproteobacteria bacterium]
MIDFELNETQQQIKSFVHMFAEQMVRPISLVADRDHGLPPEFLARVNEMRNAFTMGAIPKEYGGEGDGAGGKDKKGGRSANLTAAIGSEEMCWGDAAVVLTLPGPGLGGPPVRSMGTPEQQERFFGVFQKPGLHWGAYGLTEPGAGSDVAAIRTTCVKDGDHWILNGTKCFITNGARADWVVIFATVDAAQGRAGHRAFVVEKGTPGFRIGKIEEKMGLRASETAELVLEDARVPAANLLGGEDSYRTKEGFMGAMKTFDSTRPLVGAMAIGIGRAAYEHARDFVKEHYLLSRPVPRYRAIAERLARIARRLDAARLLVWRAAWMADRGLANAKEASMAKAYAGQAAIFACIEAIEVCGAPGAAAGSDHAFLDKWFRDIKVFDIFEGTGQIQRIVISKRILSGLKSF